MKAASKSGCPICGRRPQAEFRPFCSKRCADIDLGRWLGETYVISAPADPDEMPSLPDDED
jgi:endogenous inhibitor of DNA gyrase (YacG/DUF329 family)